jgi:intracellular sulfur oxidation DsrE/DsrF family protein
MNTKYKVVFHVDYLTRIDLALENIENLLVDIGESNLEVELVANFEAIILLAKNSNKYEHKIAELATRGVIFAACANAMRSHNLTKDDMLEVAVVVPSAVGELIKKQSQGWAYIKP